MEFIYSVNDSWYDGSYKDKKEPCKAARPFSIIHPEKSDKAVLCIHGYTGYPGEVVRPARDLYEAGFDIYAPRLPGHGTSGDDFSKVKYQDLISVPIKAAKDLLGRYKEVYVFGHSMGGGIAINLAVDHPETFTGAILFAPQTSAEASGVTAMFARSGIMQTLYSIVLKFALMFPSIVRSLVEMSFSDAEFADTYDLSRITRPFRIEGSGAGVAIMASHTRGSDLVAFSQLDIPCVILTAADDRVASADNLQKIIDNAPEGTIVESGLAGGHMMMEYNPVLAAELTLKVVSSK